MTRQASQILVLTLQLEDASCQLDRSCVDVMFRFRFFIFFIESVALRSIVLDTHASRQPHAVSLLLLQNMLYCLCPLSCCLCFASLEMSRFLCKMYHMESLSEHPPDRRKKCQNVWLGIIGCKDKRKTSSWHLIGFPDGSNIESQQHRTDVYFSPPTLLTAGTFNML